MNWSKERGSATLEDAFISYLEEAAGSRKKRRLSQRQRRRQASVKQERPALQPAAVAGVTAAKPCAIALLPGDLIRDGYGPMPGVKQWSCCAIPSGWHSRSSVLSF